MKETVSDASKIEAIVLSSKVKHVIYRGREYYFIINPISTGVSPIESDVIRIAAEIISKKIDANDVDYILTFEAMGIHLATAVSLYTGLPIIVARKKRYLDDMIEIQREEDSLYISSEITGSRIVIIDSIVSTGTTIVETIKKLREYDVSVKGIYVVIDRVDQGGSKKILCETGLNIDSIIKIMVEKGEIKLIQ